MAKRKRKVIGMLWVLYIIAALAFASATGLTDGNAVSTASLGWSRNPDGWFPIIHWGQLFLSAGFFGAGIVLYHLYVGMMIQANVRSSVLQSLIWITIMTVVVAYKDRVFPSWTTFERGWALAIILQLLVLVVLTGRHE